MTKRREIKYKFFHPGHGMGGPLDLIQLMDLDGMTGLGSSEDKKCIPLQFTGLTDKNGKDIYEGDVVVHKYPDKSKEILQVKWHKNRWAYRGRPQSCIIPGNTVEVIGNVFENPQLLQGETDE